MRLGTILVALLSIYIVYTSLWSKHLTDEPTIKGSGEGKSLDLPSREALVAQLENTEFDMLIIGGGATGAGTALEAVQRGLKVALFEMEDFASGTSSRSTKLLHGGVRYLRKAIERRDASQYHLVREALHERWLLFQQAPHLTNPLPILTPSYDWVDLAFSYVYLKLYDWIAYPHIHTSSLITPKTAAAEFPMLKTEGLKGAVVYYDGQFDDARFDLAVVLTAIKNGAVALNRFKVVGMTASTDSKDPLRRVQVQDVITGATYVVKARSVVNAAGHFADEVRLMDDPSAVRVLQASAGTHIVLDKSFCPPGQGLLISKTEDRRVLFLLPWEGMTLAGTTDGPSEITNNPRPSEKDIEYILAHLNKYFNVEVKRENVKAAWSGIRPLKKATDEKDTASISREHAIYTSPSGMLTIIGGKWTTYRKMAVDVVDKAVQVSGLLPPLPHSDTENIVLVGAEEYDPDYELVLKDKYGLDGDVAHHLGKAYGDQAWRVAEAVHARGNRRLVEGYPFSEGEVEYVVRVEYALEVSDVIERRCRLALLDRDAAERSLDRVSTIMAELLDWTEEQRLAQVSKAKSLL